MLLKALVLRPFLFTFGNGNWIYECFVIQDNIPAVEYCKKKIKQVVQNEHKKDILLLFLAVFANSIQ